MTALYGVLPPVMAWKLREQQQQQEEERVKEVGCVETAATKAPKRQQQQQQHQRVAPPVSPSFSPLLPGGRAALTALTTASVVVEVGRLADDLEGWRKASEGAAAAAGAAAASSSSPSSFAVSSSAISTAFEGFLAGSDAGEKLLSSSVVAHVSELLATILP